MITNLDCSGNTTYEIGTRFRNENGNIFRFGYSPDISKEDIIKYDISPSWIDESDRNNVLVCSTPWVGKGELPNSSTNASIIPSFSSKSNKKKKNAGIIGASIVGIIGIIYITYRALK